MPEDLKTTGWFGHKLARPDEPAPVADVTLAQPVASATAPQQPRNVADAAAAESRRRDQVVATAAAEGRIIDTADWRALFDKDPKGIEHLLTAPSDQGGLVRVTAAAAAPAPTTTGWFPGLGDAA